VVVCHLRACLPRGRIRATGRITAWRSKNVHKITAAFAILQTARTDTGVFEIFIFATGAVVAFAIIAAVASGFFREELEDQHSNVKSLAGALSFFSVGLALGVAYLVGILIEGRWAWPVSAFLTTTVYIVAVGVELTVAHRMLRRDE
jgi:MFS family permease